LPPGFFYVQKEIQSRIGKAVIPYYINPVLEHGAIHTCAPKAASTRLA